MTGGTGWTPEASRIALDLANGRITLTEALEAAWSSGHTTRWRRGPACRCAAWSPGECACGRYGTSTLRSLRDDNPFKIRGHSADFVLVDEAQLTLHEISAVKDNPWPDTPPPSTTEKETS